MIQNIFPPHISMHSVSLTKLGFNEVAFEQNHVFDVINWCQINRNIILGGDVYKICSSSVEALGDSWYFEPENSITDSEFSCKIATEYINKYTKTNNGNFAFSFVIRSN